MNAEQCDCQLVLENARHVQGKCLHWLCDNIDAFNPEDTEKEAIDSIPITHKALIELSLLLYYTDLISPDTVPVVRQELAARISHYANLPVYKYQVARTPKLLLLYAPMALFLDKLCSRNSELEHSIASSIEIGRKFVIDGYPFRHLDYLNWPILNNNNHADSFREKESYERTILGNGGNLFELSKMDAYNITHTAFYLTNFGLRWPEWLGEHPSLNRARDMITCLLCRYQYQSDHDLLAELIVSSICLGSTSLDLLTEGWTTLRTAQAPDGMIANKPITAGADKKSTWRNAYHTVIVTALAGSVTCRHLITCQHATSKTRNNISQESTRNPNPSKGIHCFVKSLSAAALALATICDKLPMQDRVRSFAQIAFYARVCSVFEHQLLHSKIKEVCASIICDNCNELSSIYDAETLLLFGELLTKLNADIPSVNSAIRHIADTLNAAGDSVQEPEMAPILHYMKERDIVKIGISSTLVMRCVCNIINQSDDKTDIADVVNKLSRITPWSGGLDIGATDLSGKFYKKMHQAAEFFHKNYSISGMAMVAYLLVATGYRKSVVAQDLLEIIVSQQKPDGTFGYYKHAPSCQIDISNLVSVIQALSSYAHHAREEVL